MKKAHLFNNSIYLCFVFSFHFQYIFQPRTRGWRKDALGTGLHIFCLSLAVCLIYTCSSTILLSYNHSQGIRMHHRIYQIIIAYRFTCGKRKIWQNIKKSQNMKMILDFSSKWFSIVRHEIWLVYFFHTSWKK